MKENVFLFIIKDPFYVQTYGSLKRLFEDEGHRIPKKIQTIYNSVDLDLEDFEVENVMILKRSIQRKKQNFL